MNPQVYIKRRENKLHQKDIAKKLLISRQSYSLKELGKREFTISEARMLARHYRCTLDELFN